jgi:hypothetical protein
MPILIGAFGLPPYFDHFTTKDTKSTKGEIIKDVDLTGGIMVLRLNIVFRPIYLLFLRVLRGEKIKMRIAGKETYCFSFPIVVGYCRRVQNDNG